jgi:hypothetical protein
MMGAFNDMNNTGTTHSPSVVSSNSSLDINANRSSVALFIKIQQ